MLRKLRKLMTISRRDGGFSLLENLISVAIFSVGILSISMLFTQTMTYSHFSEKFAVAVNLARGEMERLKNTPYTNIVPDETTKTVDNVPFRLVWEVAENTPVKSVKRVVMHVYWTDLRRDHEIKIETLYSRF
jgi:Tfp pilus assembly protein PilV